MAAPLVIVNADFTTILTPVAPTQAQLAGDGGPEYDIPPNLLTVNTDFVYQLVDGGHVKLTLVVENPSTFPRRVKATITTAFALANGILDWGDGQQTAIEGGTTATHDYEDGGIWGVLYTGENAIGFLVQDDESIVLPFGFSTNPYTEIPRESKHDVLNLSLGRHGYEPIVAAPFPVDRLAVKRSGGAALIAGAAERTLISFTTDSDIVLSSITIEGDADGLFSLWVAGSLQESRRLQRSRGHDNLLDNENTIGVPRNKLIEVKVQNVAFTSGSYRATMRGRRGPLGVI